MQRLAEHAGLSQSYISELEHGKQPSRAAVQRLALELKADEHLGLLAAGFAQDDVKYVLHPDAIRLVEAFEGTDPVGRELLLQAAEVALRRERAGAVGRRVDADALQGPSNRTERPGMISSTLRISRSDLDAPRRCRRPGAAHRGALDPLPPFSSRRLARGRRHAVPDDRELGDWKRVARAIHAYVEERAFDMLEGCSVYIPLDIHTPASDPSGFVMLNASYSARTRARALVHELAHHLLWPSLPNWGVRHQIESELAAYALRHNVARRVVDLCFSSL